MTFLPIVERELRVASRKKSTFFIRSASAMIALLASVPIYFFATMMGAIRSGKTSAGGYLFEAQSCYVFVIALFAGIFLAAGSLSEERRQGTLGLLFLTDLRGYDVVLGKFMAISLNAFYGLLALFPILSLSLLGGGVTGSEFWRTMLVLVNTLFYSVTTSLWVSSRSGSSQRALGNAIGLLLFLIVAAGVLPLVLEAKTSPRLYPLLFYLGAISPVRTFHLASAAGYFQQHWNFWTSLIISHLVGWIFLGLASWHLSRSVEEKPMAATGFWNKWLGRLTGRKRRRPALLEINPVLWQMADSPRLRWIVWTLALTGSVIISGTSSSRVRGMLAYSLVMPFLFVLKFLFTVQACRFFSEARRTGTLELLCSTPLSSHTILRGQWLALGRIFLWPVVVLLASEFFATFHFPGRMGMPFGFGFFGFLGIYQIIRSVTNFLALGWFGMWLALSSKKPDYAAGLALLFVLVLPSFVICVPGFATDIVFMVWARAKLLENFRKMAAGLPSSA